MFHVQLTLEAQQWRHDEEGYGKVKVILKKAAEKNVKLAFGKKRCQERKRKRKKDVGDVEWGS